MSDTLRWLCVFGLVSLLMAGCGNSDPLPDKQPEAAAAQYALTHSEDDAEFLLAWDDIVARCPAAAEQKITGVFARRGESVAISPGRSFGVEAGASIAWMSQRGVEGTDPGSGRSMSVNIAFHDGPGTAAEYVTGVAGAMRASVAEADGIVVASLESEFPLRAVQQFVGGNGMVVHIIETAPSGVDFYCGPSVLGVLVSMAKANILRVSDSSP